jgi:ABC-type phosphate transport system substrate-binding protein
VTLSPRARAASSRSSLRGPRAAAIVVAGAALAALTLVAAGCGGSSGAKVAQVGTTSTAKGSGSSSGSGSRDPQAFSACMRAHGVANFPDPGADGTIQIPSSIRGSEAGGRSPP